MLVPFVIFSLLTTTCAQPCTNCIPQPRQYQYVVNVPLVPVQGVAIPSNSPSPCCNPPQSQATSQLIWFNQGNGQQNSGMISNFTAISTQGGFNYQNPGAQQPGAEPNINRGPYINQGQGNYMTPGTPSPYSPAPYPPSSPIPNQSGFTSPPSNYNPNVYLQGSTTPPSEMPIMSPGGQPYNPGNQGAYNAANTGYLENQGGFTTGPMTGQGGPNPMPNGQENLFGQDQGQFQGNSNFPQQEQGMQGEYYPPGQGPQGGEYYPPGEPQFSMSEPFPGQPDINNPQYNPQEGPVGNNGIVVTQSGNMAGFGVAGAAAGFPYSTSTQYPATTPFPPTNSPYPPSSSGGFPYSTQNPNNFSPQGQQGGFSSTPYPPTDMYSPQGYPFPGQQNQNFPSSTPYPPTMAPNQGEQRMEYISGNPQQNMQGNYNPSTGEMMGSTTPFPPNEGQLNQGGMPGSASPQQFSPSSSSQFGPSGGPTTPFYGSTSPYQDNTMDGSMGGSTTPFNYVYPGTTQGPNFGQSIQGGMSPTGNYPPGAQQDQASTTRPPYVNAGGVGGGQTATTFIPAGASTSSSGSSMLGQGPTGVFMGPQASTTMRPFYDSNTYGPMLGGSPGNPTAGPFGPTGAGAGGAGFTPQFDFENNMNTQYGRYNSTSATGGLNLVLVAVLTLLFF